MVLTKTVPSLKREVIKPMAIQKNNTQKRDYIVSVSLGNKLETTISVRAEGVRDAIRKAYSRVCGWQGVPDDLDAQDPQTSLF